MADVDVTQLTAYSTPTGNDILIVIKAADDSLNNTTISELLSLVSVPSAYTSNPAALGTASPGSSTSWARGDHVHAKPTYSKSDVGLGNVDNVQQYSASNPPPYPVSSVNGQTGDVVLDAGDIEYSDAATYSSGSVGAEVADLKSAISGGGLTPAIKAALLQLAEKVAYIDDQGQDYYQDLYDALYPPAELESISAVYTQSGTVYDTDSLDSLKADLVVTATYVDSSTAVITSYTLSGTLTEGTSTITVAYGGKSTTFNVTVSINPLPTGYSRYDYVQRTASGNGLGVLTNIAFSTDYTLETEIMYTSTTEGNPRNVLGIRNGNSGTKEFGVFITPTTGKIGYWINNADSTQNSTPFTANTRTTLKYLPVGKGTTYPTQNVFVVNNVECQTGNSDTGVTFNAWLGLHAYGISATSLTTNTIANIGLAIGETVIKDATDTVIHDLVPVSDGINIGYVDWMNGTLYLANDSTKFTVGNWT